MKQVTFVCPEHGALDNLIEYADVQVGTFLFANVCMMFCSECNAYYTPYTNLLCITNFRFNGYAVNKSMINNGIVVPRHNVLDLKRTRMDAQGTQANIPLELNEQSNKNSYRNRPKKIQGYNICELNNINRNAFKRIFLTNYILEECCTCGKKLVEYTSFLPIDGDTAIKVPGKLCTKCDRFFEMNGYKLQRICNELSIKDTSFFDLQYIIPGYKERLNSIRKIQSATIAIHLKENHSDKHRIIAIVKSPNQESTDDDIYYYSNRKALVLLSSLFRKDTIVWFEEKEYVIRNIPLRDASGVEKLLIDKIVLRKGGGLYHGIHQPHIELVDILLHSPFTNCLEIAHASYDKVNRVYYMDSAVYRAFVEKYGNPGIALVAYQSGKKDLFSMSEESLLHTYGYIVGNNGLGNSARHELLAEVLDLELMTAHSIVNLLNHNISMHPNEIYYQARCDWEVDKEFVMKYKVNPNRFVVASIGLID